MDVSTIHNELRQGITRKFYIFTGDEWAVQQIYIDQIITVLKREFDGVQSKRIDSISQLVSKKSNRSFVKQKYVYTVRDDKEFIAEEKLQNMLTQLVGDNVVILLLTNADKRTKFYKKYKDDIVVFEPLKDHVLKQYILKHMSLSNNNVERLIEVCEHDYGRILLELDKCQNYMYAAELDGYDLNSDEAFKELLDDGTIFIPPQDAIFDFVDAILDYKPKLAFDLYAQCRAVGEATLVMISVLYNNAKAVLQVQSCDSNDVSKTTGLTGWQIMNAEKHLNIYSNGDLLYIMELCLKAEQGIKTGKVDEKYAMEYILVNGMY